MRFCRYFAFPKKLLFNIPKIGILTINSIRFLIQDRLEPVREFSGGRLYVFIFLWYLNFNCLR